MAYEIRSQNGMPIKKEGKNLLASDILEVKIEQLDDKDKSFVAIASTEHEDRDKDVIRQDGWNLANFKKNPIVPWSHNYYGVPVAKSMKTWIDKSNKTIGPRLLFMPKFDEADDESMKVYNKYKNGFLTSFSVGFRGIESKFRDEENRWYGGMEFLKQELLEISAVSVPANPHASTRMGYAGGDIPKNLLQLGYPEVFAKTESGLFYPVMDIAVYSTPTEVEVIDGIKGIHAIHLESEEATDGPIAYIFDPKKFDDKSANEWIKDNVAGMYTTKYFDLKIDKDGFTLEEVEDEEEIKHFDESIDLIEGNTPDEENKTEGGDNPDDEIKTDDPPAVPEVKQFIEVTTVIKDSKGNIIDKDVNLVAVMKEYKTVNEYIEESTQKELNKLKSLIKVDAMMVDSFINLFSNEKMVANIRKVLDNKGNTNPNDGDLSDGNQSTNNKDEYELDDSLFSNPGDNNDKSNSEDLIEFDEETFTESKSDVSKTIKDVISEILPKMLNEVVDKFSGKID